MSNACATDATHCERITRAHARTFSLAGRFLPAEKRRAANAVYAFCRVADDLVDEADERSPSAVSRELLEYDRALNAALAGHAEGPIFRELAWACSRFGVPPEPLHALLDAIAIDLTPRRYETWPELASYCAGVASTVGEMCAHIFGIPDATPWRASALAHARTLGVALQLTNILRDVGEDAERGRCYLPAEDLLAFGVRPEEVLGRRVAADDSRWRALMAFEVGRARSLFEASAPGLALVRDDARLCAQLCADGYAGILGAIERNGYDSLTRRASVGPRHRASIVWHCWRTARGGLSSRFTDGALPGFVPAFAQLGHGMLQAARAAER